MKAPVGTLRALARTFADERATQIVEFALSLPLLVLFVVGIFDFSGAVTLKQKLTNAAREGARVAAADPAGDLSAPASALPLSVSDAFYIVDTYLLSEKINDCALSSATPTQTGGTLTWVATSGACPGTGSNGITLTINRGCITAQSTSGIDVVDTCVTIQYPYAWKFTGVAGLFGGNFLPATSITTTAVAFNEN